MYRYAVGLNDHLGTLQSVKDIELSIVSKYHPLVFVSEIKFYFQVMNSYLMHVWLVLVK